MLAFPGSCRQGRDVRGMPRRNCPRKKAPRQANAIRYSRRRVGAAQGSSAAGVTECADLLFQILAARSGRSSKRLGRRFRPAAAPPRIVCPAGDKRVSARLYRSPPSGAICFTVRFGIARIRSPGMASRDCCHLGRPARPRWLCSPAERGCSEDRAPGSLGTGLCVSGRHMRPRAVTVSLARSREACGLCLDGAATPSRRPNPC